MARTTQQKRDLWGPPCRGVTERVALYGSAVVAVDPRIVEATRALNDVLARWGYKTRRADTGAYNCRKITGGKGYSLHAYGIAVDINWNTNPYGTTKTDMPSGMVDEIEAIRTTAGLPVWEWGGDWRTPDTMHYEIAASPAELAAGIARTDPAKPGALIVTPDDAKQIRAIVREETTTGSNRTCEFLTAVIYAAADKVIAALKR
jgi:hypothetical protein